MLLDTACAYIHISFRYLVCSTLLLLLYSIAHPVGSIVTVLYTIQAKRDAGVLYSCDVAMDHWDLLLAIKQTRPDRKSMKISGNPTFFKHMFDETSDSRTSKISTFTTWSFFTWNDREQWLPIVNLFCLASEFQKAVYKGFLMVFVYLLSLSLSPIIMGQTWTNYPKWKNMFHETIHIGESGTAHFPRTKKPWEVQKASHGHLGPRGKIKGTPEGWPSMTLGGTPGLRLMATRNPGSTHPLRWR